MFIIILSISDTKSFAQYCTPDNRFTETAIFTNSQIDSTVNVVYGNAKNNLGYNQNLYLNLYYPSSTVETLNSRPLIVLMHGGMFLNGDRSNLTATCIEFAKRGFIAATIGYRLGWTYVPNCQSVTPEVVVSSNRAIYRAIQDLHASVRYLVHFATDFSIDTAWIFAGGVSAGAFATADLAFITPEEFSQHWPYCNDPQFGEPLGFINTSGNSFTDSFTLKGLFHNWGSVVDNDYIRPHTALPMIGFAGDEDQISPIDSGFFYGCPRYELMFGTRAIYDRLGNFGACSQINVKLHAGHGVYNSTSAQGIFRIAKACCFFKSIFCGDCTTSYTTDSIPAACSVNTSSLSIPLTEPLRIEPNPGSGIFTLISNTPVGTPLLVCNMQGKLVYSTILNSSRGQFDISHLNAGVYLVSVNKQRTHLILVK